MKKNGLIILLLIIATGHVRSQTNDLMKTEIQLRDSFKLFFNDPFGANSDSLRNQLKSRLTEVLNEEKTFDHPFDSLGQYLRIITSRDKKIRVFSWDQLSGGTWHYMVSIAQFKTTSERVLVKDLVKEDSGNTHFSDVVNYEIHEIKDDTKKYYLIFGYGTHGSGHHHKSAQIFSIENESLVRCDSCFESDGMLIQEIPRRYKIKMEFDPEKKSITFDEFSDEDNTGFSEPTGNKFLLRFSNGIFRKE